MVVRGDGEWKLGRTFKTPDGVPDEPTEEEMSRHSVNPDVRLPIAGLAGDAFDAANLDEVAE